MATTQHGTQINQVCVSAVDVDVTGSSTIFALYFAKVVTVKTYAKTISRIF